MVFGPFCSEKKSNVWIVATNMLHNFTRVFHRGIHLRSTYVHTWMCTFTYILVHAYMHAYRQTGRRTDGQACMHAGIQTSELNKEGIAYGHHCVQQVYIPDLHRISIWAKRHVGLWSLAPMLGVNQALPCHQGSLSWGAPIHWLK